MNSSISDFDGTNLKLDYYFPLIFIHHVTQVKSYDTRVSSVELRVTKENILDFLD